LEDGHPVTWPVWLTHTHWSELGVNRQDCGLVQGNGEIGQINGSLDQDAPTPDRTCVGRSGLSMIRVSACATFNSCRLMSSSLVHTALRFSRRLATRPLTRYLPKSIDDTFKPRQEC
jgi:hypothetical protein